MCMPEQFTHSALERRRDVARVRNDAFQKILDRRWSRSITAEDLEVAIIGKKLNKMTFRARKHNKRFALSD